MAIVRVDALKTTDERISSIRACRPRTHPLAASRNSLEEKEVSGRLDRRAHHAGEEHQSGEANPRLDCRRASEEHGGVAHGGEPKHSRPPHLLRQPATANEPNCRAQIVHGHRCTQRSRPEVQLSAHLHGKGPDDEDRQGRDHGGHHLQRHLALPHRPGYASPWKLWAQPTCRGELRRFRAPGHFIVHVPIPQRSSQHLC